MSAHPLQMIEGQVLCFRDAMATNEEAWKRDHLEAMDCLDIESEVALAIMLFDAIDKIDEQWRLGLAHKRFEYSALVDEIIERLGKEWHAAAVSLLRRVERKESEFHVRRADEFRERFKTAEETLCDR